MLVELSILLCCLYCVWFVYTTKKERKTLPPGPFPLPLIGNAHQVGKDMPYSMEYLRKKYGDVFTLRVPSGNFIVVNSGKVMHEMLVKSKDDFANRPSGSRLIARDLFNNKAIPFVPYAPFYQFCRKVIKYALHMYGEGVKTAESRVQHEVTQLLIHMEEKKETPFCPKELLSQTISNVTTSWLLSQRYDFGDPIFKTFRTFVDNVLYVSHQWTNIDFLPFYEYLPFDIPRRFRQTKQVRDEYFGKNLEEHRKSYKDGVVRDIADALLAAYEKEKVDGKGKDIGTSDDIKTIMMDFFIASSDTTAATLSWLILYMVLHQEVMHSCM
jgi:cytochrome P450